MRASPPFCVVIISIAIDDTHVCGMNPTDCLAAKCGAQADPSCQAWHGNACPWMLGCQACMACMQTGPISVILLAGLSLTLPGAPAIGFTLIFSMAQSTMDPVTLAMSHVGLPTSLQTVLPSGLSSVGPQQLLANPHLVFCL